MKQKSRVGDETSGHQANDERSDEQDDGSEKQIGEHKPFCLRVWQFQEAGTRPKEFTKNSEPCATAREDLKTSVASSDKCWGKRLNAP